MKHLLDLTKTTLSQSIDFWHCEAADAERYYGETVVLATDREGAIMAARVLFQHGMIGAFRVEAEEHYIKMLNKKVLPTPEEAYNRRL